MNDTDFEAQASAALQALEQALENCGEDLDFELKAGGILEIEFDDRSKIIVNRHGAAREIWVAARSGGFHYRWDGKAWRDTRDGSELFAALSKRVSEQLGRSVHLRLG
jgi:CyaY protein